ncbi:MAG: FKBP-type peptidyl-prolyl cis-trans isomerase [Nitrososphaerota archaeon]|nr:peptidylprolyl isomerase [Aigarchaeota archaeon]MDW8076586.1 FKBP-type peptidyl-prolyl cis-trans isomerase [Nitrososphaerota archaeon]
MSSESLETPKEKESTGESRASEVPKPSLPSGSFVLVDYSIRIKETGELVDTTSEEEARQAGIYDASRLYEPRLAIIGKGMLLKAIEDELVTMSVGESKTFEISPEKAFGQRDPAKVKVYPIRKFKDVEAPLVVGAKVNIDGKEGIIRSIGSGRVQVDFNPYLAGKTLVCSITVRKLITDDREKVQHILHNRLPDVDLQKFAIEFAPPEITITIPEEAYLLPNLQIVKRLVAKEIQENIQGIERVKVIELYTRQT